LDGSRVLTVFVAPDRVTVLVPFVNVDPVPDVSQFPETVHEPLVIVIVPDVPPVIVTFPNVTVDVVEVSVPPFWTVRFAPPDKVRPPVIRVPEIVRDDETPIAVDIVRDPLTVTVTKLCPAARLTVFDVPVNVTLDEVDVKDVADAVFQLPPIEIVAEAKVIVAAPEEVRLPLNVGVALVRVRVPVNVTFDETVVEIPELTVRLLNVWGTLIVPPEVFTTTVPLVVNEPAEVSIDVTVIVDEPAVSVPLAATVSAATVRARFDVARVVTALPPWTVIEPAVRPRVLIVKVTALEPLLKTTVENSFADRLDPAKVIVCDVAALNVTVAVPPDHEALVEAFVHEPLKVHGPLPKAMYAPDAEMFTLPVTLPLDAPDMEMLALPDRVRVPVTVKPFAVVAPIVIEPPACVTLPDTAKSNVPMAIVPIVEPVVSREAIAAFTFTVVVPEPLFALNFTAIEEVGTGQPNAPPEEDAQ
jgi:hypothetical protein